MIQLNTLSDNYSRYFPISRRDERWGLYLLGCGASKITHSAEFPLRSHPAHHYFSWKRGRILPEYQIFYLLKGKGILETDASGRIDLQAGNMVFLFPGVWHRYKPLPEEEWHTFWASFEGSTARHLMSQLHCTTTYPVQFIGHQQPVIQLFLELLETSRSEFAGYQQVLAGQISTLLGWLHALQRKETFRDRDIDTLMHRARLVILNNPPERSMEEVAATLGMGYSKFRKVFRRYTGMAPKQYQVQLRIQKAMLLLNDESRSIKEVAAETGFDSPYYFSRIFKKKTGYSPQEYRRRMWEER